MALEQKNREIEQLEEQIRYLRSRRKEAQACEAGLDEDGSVRLP